MSDPRQHPDFSRACQHWRKTLPNAPEEVIHAKATRHIEWREQQHMEGAAIPSAEHAAPEKVEDARNREIHSAALSLRKLEQVAAPEMGKALGALKYEVSVNRLQATTDAAAERTQAGQLFQHLEAVLAGESVRALERERRLQESYQQARQDLAVWQAEFLAQIKVGLKIAAVWAGFTFLVLVLLLAFSVKAHAQFSHVNSIQLLNNDNSSAAFFTYPFTLKVGVHCTWVLSGSIATIDCTGGAGSTEIQVNGVDTTAQTPINFQSGTNITASNPSAGNVKFDFSGTLAANTTATTHQFFTAYNSTTGAFTKAQPACGDLSDAGTLCTSSASPVTNTGTLTLNKVIIGNGTSDIKASALDYNATWFTLAPPYYLFSTTTNHTSNPPAGNFLLDVETSDGLLHCWTDAGASCLATLPATKTAAAGQPLLAYDSTTGLFTQGALTATNVGLGSVTNDAQTKAAIVPNTAPSAGQILVGNAGGTAYAPQSLSGSGATFSLSSAGALTVSSLALASLATQAADTVVANATGGVAAPTAVAIGSCSTASSALTYSTSSHAFGCNSISGTGTVTVVSSGSLTSTAFTTGGGTTLVQTPSATSTLDASGNASFPGSVSVSAAGGFFADGTEGTAPTAATSHDTLYADSTAHRWKMNNNNGGAVQVVASGADINSSDQVTITHIAGGTNTDLAAFNASGNLVNYAGATSCTNQALTGLSAAGASTCSTVTQGFVDATVNGYATAGAGAVNPAATTDTKLAEIQLATAYLSVANKALDGHTHVVVVTGTTQTPTYTLKVKACTVSGCGSGTALTLCTLGATGAMTASNTVNAHVDFSILVTTTGASGVLETSCHGPLNITQLGTGGVWWQDINNAGSSTIDLTGTIFIDIVGQISTQSGTKNSMQARLTTLKPVN